MKITRVFTAFCLLLPTVPLFAQTPQSAADSPVDFNRDVRPILSNRCLACHGPDDGQREAGLRLDDATSATGRLESGKIAIVPGKPQDSELLQRIHSSDDDIRMPPPEFGKPLTAAEQSILQKW
ncbi:MAG: c-type cytochrome domain-containing protein, partial [Planctomycetaceae bacterium]